VRLRSIIISLSRKAQIRTRDLATAHELNGLGPSYHVVVEGKQQDLSPMLQDEVYRISREVIRNAFAHAAASRIEVEIRYDQDQLRLRVRDDGKGIDPKVLEAGGQSGHFGIPGMRERHSASVRTWISGAKSVREPRCN
jgi:signal transduction histidine kinase